MTSTMFFYEFNSSFFSHSSFGYSCIERICGRYQSVFLKAEVSFDCVRATYFREWNNESLNWIVTDQVEYWQNLKWRMKWDRRFSGSFTLSSNHKIRKNCRSVLRIFQNLHLVSGRVLFNVLKSKHYDKKDEEWEIIFLLHSSTLLLASPQTLFFLLIALPLSLSSFHEWILRVHVSIWKVQRKTS